MLAPLSWLKEYVDIKMNPKQLGERLTEIGLGTEKIIKENDDVIFEFEITPNRPDLLSILGIAREIAAIEGKSIIHPKGVDINLTPKKILPLTIKTDAKINPRFTGIIIDGIKVKQSPDWLKNRLVKIGQRPINNIVDITNYVMFELGNPIHAFDYDKITGHQIEVKLAKGGESFTSVDGLIYHLPKDAVIICDDKKIIDLCGIKGGANSGTLENTKTIFIRVPVELPNLIRRTSQSLGLRSEASSIFERGVNAGGTIEALRRCVDLVLEEAGGEIASKLYDLKESSFSAWKLKLNLERLDKILGISIEEKKVLKILESLNLSPKKISKDTIETTVPTYRNDLKIEEDLIEEVARLYGYNNFPKTQPTGQVPIIKAPYFKDYQLDEKVKNFLMACGSTEICSYSLISEQDLLAEKINPQNTLRVDNPVSREFEYLRPTLKINLVKALRQNIPNFKNVDLFELGKVYLGKNLEEAKEEYFLSGISNNKNFLEVKGIIEALLKKLGVDEDPSDYIEIINEGIIFEINYSHVLEKYNPQKIYKPIPKYPPVVEDLSLMVSADKKTGEIIGEIKKQSQLITEVSFLNQFKDTRTFHIVYQHKEQNLTNEEVAKIRKKILEVLKKKFGVN